MTQTKKLDDRAEAERQATISKLLTLTHDSPEWPAVMSNLLELPLDFLPGVRYVLKRKSWVRASDPLSAVRKQSINAHRRTLSGRVRGSPARDGNS